MQTQQNILQRFAMRVSDWSEKWFPDSYIFALLGVIIVAIAAIGIGAPAQDVAISFGDGFWSLIPFTLQMHVDRGRLCSFSFQTDAITDSENGAHSSFWTWSHRSCRHS